MCDAYGNIPRKMFKILSYKRHVDLYFLEIYTDEYFFILSIYSLTAEYLAREGVIIEWPFSRHRDCHINVTNGC